MIVADRKSLQEILAMVEDNKKILIAGCKGCVTVCNVGGLKEVEILASSMKIARKKQGNDIEIDIDVLERQCDIEYVAGISEKVGDYDAVISLACGVGPQFLSEMYKDQTFYPGVNTTFFGGATQHGIWEERCAGCGTCGIHNFGGLCPIARCAKSLMNGPCGGSSGGICEVNKETECIWDSIVRKKMDAGRLEDLIGVKGIKNWRTARDGGPRRSIREELVQGNI
ncbi:MAG: methylenetetrahydrofolate reductase C-terminal domain-containing protein [Proteobacteria bacterium]|nr:methylenetetrahydrofolate reductase C-terminal domain-containing protein [Pseudomonadota bacterium]MBU1582873.1 methylenetetrahydrofolate reductase C-terminal domain-containing protein [Pseudomonadota bacterium]MBU2452784.1 methylenetetrahydrofolate reductase C-terminal domain-containing protein [Pseudomonadota bacterium]MBU2629490.1 methylenetetrahydrofolate reductase C-terminal domain-containing protein [Pseudomonadota bacterium]